MVSFSLKDRDGTTSVLVQKLTRGLNHEAVLTEGGVITTLLQSWYMP